MSAGKITWEIDLPKCLASLLLLLTILTGTNGAILAGEKIKSSQNTDMVILKKTAQNVISSQIDAFRNLDVNTAYSFASPFIRSKFSNAKVFGEMVATGYPMIWAPKKYKFLEFNLFNGALIQRVLFIDSMEKIFIFDYEIREYNSNTWLINGVFPVKSSVSDV